MTYPIDAETFIRALRMEHVAVDKDREDAYREAVRLVNMCYADGLQGASGYPLNVDAARREFAEEIGKDLKDNPLVQPLIDWCNDAYEQGRKEADQ